MSLLPVDQAREQLLAQARPLCTPQTLSLAQAAGHYLAAPVSAPLSVPPCDNAAVDGIAVALAELQQHNGSLPITLRVTAGDAPGALQHGAARIFTGAPVPSGADTVLMQEDCEFEGGQVRVKALSQCQAGSNIRRAGQDVQTGDTVVEAGQRLYPYASGLLASLGLQHVAVHRPRILVVTSGDELLQPGQPNQPGKIYDSNGPLLCQLLSSAGFSNVSHHHLPDDPDQIVAFFSARQAEPSQAPALIISTGGVSVGEEDHLRHFLTQHGQLDFWRLAIKPGKPFTFGELRGVPFIGLPGNPSAVLVCTLMLVLPFLRRCCGAPQVLPPALSLPADFAVDRAGKRLEFLRCRRSEKDGHQWLEKHPNQSSGMLSSALWSEGLAVVAAGQTLQPGTPLPWYSFAELLY